MRTLSVKSRLQVSDRPGSTHCLGASQPGARGYIYSFTNEHGNQQAEWAIERNGGFIKRLIPLSPTQKTERPIAIAWNGGFAFAYPLAEADGTAVLKVHLVDSAGIEVAEYTVDTGLESDGSGVCPGFHVVNGKLYCVYTHVTLNNESGATNYREGQLKLAIFNGFAWTTQVLDTWILDDTDTVPLAGGKVLPEISSDDNGNLITAIERYEGPGHPGQAFGAARGLILMKRWNKDTFVAMNTLEFTSPTTPTTRPQRRPQLAKPSGNFPTNKTMLAWGDIGPSSQDISVARIVSWEETPTIETIVWPHGLDDHMQPIPFSFQGIDGFITSRRAYLDGLTDIMSIVLLDGRTFFFTPQTPYAERPFITDDGDGILLTYEGGSANDANIYKIYADRLS